MVGKASTPAFLERPPQVLPNVSWVHPAAAGVQSALMEGDAATAQSLLKELLTCAKGMPAPWGVDAAAHAWVPSRGTPGFSGVREPLNARPLPPAQTCETHRATHLYTPDEKERAQLLMVMIDAERKRRVRSPSRHQRCASEWGGVRCFCLFNRCWKRKTIYRSREGKLPKRPPTSVSSNIYIG